MLHKARVANFQYSLAQARGLHEMEVIRLTLPDDLFTAFMHEFAGQRIYIPLKPRGSGRLARTIGVKHASKLSDFLGRTHAQIPMREYRHFRVLEMRRAGHKSNEIAKALCITSRSVVKITAALERNPT